MCGWLEQILIGLGIVTALSVLFVCIVKREVGLWYFAFLALGVALIVGSFSAKVGETNIDIKIRSTSTPPPAEETFRSH